MTAVAAPLIEVSGLTKHYKVRTGRFGRGEAVVHALDDVSFDVLKGETLSVVGESGSGKSTLGLTLLQLRRATSGTVVFNGQNLGEVSDRALAPIRQRLQIVFQDPFSTLHPRMTVGEAIALPIRFHRLVEPSKVRERVLAILDDVGLPRRYENHYPHEMSGGQCQRVAIGRALACEPEFIVCDEAISALDVSVQAQIVNLLVDLQEKLGLTYLFIAHDISVVRHISNRVAVMYLGHMVELGPVDGVCERPLHPYTQALLSAVPRLGERFTGEEPIAGGEIPSPTAPPSGCRFHTRCPFATDRCTVELPVLREVKVGHRAACHYAERFL